AESFTSNCVHCRRMPSASRNWSLYETDDRASSSVAMKISIDVSQVVPRVLKRYQPVTVGAKLYQAESPLVTSDGVATNGRLAIWPDSAAIDVTVNSAASLRRPSTVTTIGTLAAATSGMYSMLVSLHRVTTPAVVRSPNATVLEPCAPPKLKPSIA